MKKIVINKRCVFFLIVFSLLIALGICTLDEAISVPIIFIGCVLFFGYSITFPICCSMDSQGIAVYYVFGIVKKMALWNELKCVEDHHSGNAVLPWLRDYQIAYFKTRFPLWQKTCIPKNKKTVKLIEKYYNGTVEKYG